MSAQTNFVNDWHRLQDQIGSEHRVILASTLPTPSFAFLLEAYARDCKERLTQLDVTRPADEFHEKYKTIRLQQDLAESLLHYVKSLNTQQPT